MLSTFETTTERTGFQSLGNLESIDYIDSGIVGNTSFGKFRVLIFDKSVIRISITQYSDFDDFSYAIVGKPKTVDFHIKDNDESVLISTDQLKLHIAKKPVRFKFLDNNGKIINEDDPAFGTSWIGPEVTTYKILQEGERFVGLGEKTGGLDRRGHGFVNWNTDEFAYGSQSDPLYCTTPFYIGIHHGLSYGIFFDNSNKSHFNFGASNDRFASFMAEDGDMDYYFMHNDSVAKIIEDYTFLTGRMEIPPIWSIGYQQCRYSYYPDSKVLDIAETFRQKRIPADVIVLDIHYMDAYKIFTWHPDKFSDPKLLVEALNNMGFHVMVMCDPGIKIESGYEPYDDGIAQDVFLKYPDNTNFSGEVWPGWCHFPDFTKPETRAWWGKFFESYTDLGIDGFWNDMNELASWGQMMPEHIQFYYDGNKAFTKKGRNVYGFQMARSTFEGTKKLMKGKRPFNLTRSAYSGIQRYAAVWTGDNSADEEHMLLGVRLVNSFGLTGVAFAGYDVGGFAEEASIDLFARWISIGAFSPFFRGHSMINSRDAEPWAFGEEAEEISRNYINFRYQIMPYIYSLFYEASKTGMAIARSLAIDYTHDDHIYHKLFQNQYLFGPAFLICPVLSSQHYCKAHLPEGTWYNFHNGNLHKGNQQIIVDAPVDKLPVFIKGGSIIPSQDIVQNSTDFSNDTCKIHVYHGEESNSFTYYEDDGESYDFESGQFYERIISYDAAHKSLTFEKVKGLFKSRFTNIHLIFHGFDEVGSVMINNVGQDLKITDFNYLEAITKFDPMEPGGSVEKEKVKTVKLNNADDIIIIKW